MSSYSFRQIKLQFLELIDRTPNLNDKAYRTLVRLSLKWLDLGNGAWSMTLQALAEDLGCSEATVSRSLGAIQRTGLLDIRRGTYGRATMLRVSDAAQAAATVLRDKPGKIAGLEGYRTEQICKDNKANLPGLGQQICRPNKSPDIDGPIKIRANSFSARQWDECLEEFGLPRLDRLYPQARNERSPSYLVPTQYPDRGDRGALRRQVQQLIEWANPGEGQAAHG